MNLLKFSPRILLSVIKFGILVALEERVSPGSVLQKLAA